VHSGDSYDITIRATAQRCQRYNNEETGVFSHLLNSILSASTVYHKDQSSKERPISAPAPQHLMHPSTLKYRVDRMRYSPMTMPIAHGRPTDYRLLLSTYHSRGCGRWRWIEILRLFVGPSLELLTRGLVVWGSISFVTCTAHGLNMLRMLL